MFESVIRDTSAEEKSYEAANNFPFSCTIAKSINYTVVKKRNLPSRGRYFSFWASVPYSLMGCITKEDWTENVDRYPESTLEQL